MMNKVFSVCEECGKPRTFSTPDKTFKYNCCGKAQIADILEEEDPAPAPAPLGAPGLKDQDGDGDVDQEDIDLVVARVKAAK
jgi:hypothetical protein